MTWYAADSGPVALWHEFSDDVHGHSIDAGHFFPEEAGDETFEALNDFFARSDVRPVAARTS